MTANSEPYLHHWTAGGREADTVGGSCFAPILLRSLRSMIPVALGLRALCAQAPDPYGANILKVSEERQIAFVLDTLDRNFPAGSGEALTFLAANKSSSVLPLIEKKIEEALASKNPAECFTTPAGDPARFIGLAAATIAYAGSAESLRQIAKLVRLDENRFGEYVDRTLIQARTLGTLFTVAYGGADIWDSALTGRIIAWFGSELPGRHDFDKRQMRTWWAEAMIRRYGNRLPTGRAWREDPIASRSPAELAASMHDGVFRTMIETIEKALILRHTSIPSVVEKAHSQSPPLPLRLSGG